MEKTMRLAQLCALRLNTLYYIHFCAKRRIKFMELSSIIYQAAFTVLQLSLAGSWNTLSLSAKLVAEKDKSVPHGAPAELSSSAGTLGIFLEKDFEELFDRFILEVLLELEDSYYPIFALSAPQSYLRNWRN